jgi:hypothetical protein
MSKEEQGDGLMQSAKKHHTKSLTKWSADWDDAASDYEKAAQIFTHIDNVAKARSAWEMCSLAHEKAKNPFLAAKAVESLANFLKDHDAIIKTTEGASEVSRLYVRASNMYALDNKPEKQVEALIKASRLAPANDAASAAKLMVQGLDALEDANKHHLTLDLYRGLVLLQVRGNLMLEAVETLQREIRMFEKLQNPEMASKAGLEIVLLCLGGLGDWVLADRQFKALVNTNAYGFSHSKNQITAYNFLSAIEERDEQGLKDCIKDSALQFIIPEIAKLAKKVTMTGTNAPAKAKKPIGNQTSNTKDYADEEDEDNLR